MNGQMNEEVKGIYRAIFCMPVDDYATSFVVGDYYKVLFKYKEEESGGRRTRIYATFTLEV